ncbi:MAG: hypothetical protein CM15mP127_03200 [Gammaproteobacteria bacterium]|nr:MAG: hypothetical protein CM15mP127_03200 [Gammaproteobacteria bacterium]
MLLNIAKVFDKDFLDAGETFDVNDVRMAMANQNVSINPGDVVIFHTGWTQHKYESAPAEWGSGAPGLTPEVASYLAEMDVIAVGADTWSLGCSPIYRSYGTISRTCYFNQEHGIYILGKI